MEDEFSIKCAVIGHCTGSMRFYPLGDGIKNDDIKGDTNMKNFENTVDRLGRVLQKIDEETDQLSNAFITIGNAETTDTDKVQHCIDILEPLIEARETLRRLNRIVTHIQKDMHDRKRDIKRLMIRAEKITKDTI